jgi:hypothetical protein
MQKLALVEQRAAEAEAELLAVCYQVDIIEHQLTVSSQPSHSSRNS